MMEYNEVGTKPQMGQTSDVGKQNCASFRLRRSQETTREALETEKVPIGACQFSVFAASSRQIFTSINASTESS